jgi:hypothetical protein
MFLGIKKCIIKKQGYFFSSFFNFYIVRFPKNGLCFLSKSQFKKIHFSQGYSVHKRKIIPNL